MQVSAPESCRDPVQRERYCGGRRLCSAIRKRPREIERNHTRTDPRATRAPRPWVWRRPQWMSSRWWSLQSLAGKVCYLVQPFDTHVTGDREREGPKKLLLPSSLTVFLCHPREHLASPFVNVLTGWSLHESEIDLVTNPLSFIPQLHNPTICPLLLVVMWQHARLSKIIVQWS